MLIVAAAVLAAVIGVAVLSMSGGESEGRDVQDPGDRADAQEPDPEGAAPVIEAPDSPTLPAPTPSDSATVSATTLPPGPVTELSLPPIVEPEGEQLWGCDSQSGRDPHRLISINETADRLFSCGEETWQVFVCTTRESDQVDRVAYVDNVLSEAGEWFAWASGGQYDIDFSVGDDTSYVSSIAADVQTCYEEARQTQWSESRTGAVVLLDEARLGPRQEFTGVGTCVVESPGTDGQFGETGRMVAIAVHSSGSQEGTAVHELGHSQCWPHSFSGESSTEYDNPADVMSFAHNWPVGTIAANRYASGWIHPNQVRVHSESADSYTLSPCCSEGVQLLALLPRNSTAGLGEYSLQWWDIEVRDPADEWERGLADAGVGEEMGVLVHWIDQSRERLGTEVNRWQAQTGGQSEDWKGATLVVTKLAGPGSEFCLSSVRPTELLDCSGAYEWRLEVSASQTGGLTVAVAPATTS